MEKQERQPRIWLTILGPLGVVVVVVFGVLALAASRTPVKPKVAPPSTLTAVQPKSGATLCSVWPVPSSATRGIAQVKQDGPSWEFIQLDAVQTLRLAPSEVHVAAVTYSKAFAAWPKNHDVLDDPKVTAAAAQIDAWVAQNCK